MAAMGKMTKTVALKSVFRPMRQVAKYVTRISRAAASGESVLEILETAPETKDRSSAINAPRFQGHIQFEIVSLGCDDNEPILSDISLDVSPGEHVALAGSSGSCWSIITITHDLVQSRNLNSNVVVDEGSVVEQGTHDALMKRQDPYHALYSHQVNDDRVSQEKYCALTG